MSGDDAPAAVARFDLLAATISGRRVSVQVGNDTDLSHWDGYAIRLSARRLAEEPQVWLDVAAQALLLACGSLRPGVLGRLVGRPQVARRFAFLEVRRGVRQSGECLPAAFVRHPTLLSVGPWPLTDSVEASLQWAANLRLSMDDIPDFVGTLRPLQALRSIWDDRVSSTLAENERAGGLAEADQARNISDEEGSESSTLLDRLKSRFTVGNPMSQALSLLFDQGRSRGLAEGGEQGGAGEMPVGRVEQAWRRGVKALRAYLPPAITELATPVQGNVHSRRYPEWDCRRGSYRPGWVRVEEIEPAREAGALDLSRVLLPPGRELRRQLATLGCEHEMHRRERDGSEFDMGALVEHAIERRTGYAHANVAIYRASRRTRRDLGVLVALDISGSTGEHNAGGEQVFQQQLRAAWQLARTLDGLGDRVALYGFHSWGREMTCMVRLKGHEEPWSGRVNERCAQLEPCGYTRTGSAVRYAEQVLSALMRLPNRLMILVTDGLAYDQDYEDEYAREDTRKALCDAQAAGTACVCLCIGASATAEQLEGVLGSANMLMVDDGEQWVSKIGGVCQQALRSIRMGRHGAHPKVSLKPAAARTVRPIGRRESGAALPL